MNPDFSADRLNILTIENLGEIRTSSLGTKFRHVLFKDAKNKKTCDYIIFENREVSLWNDLLNKGDKIVIVFGRILEIKLTDEKISKTVHLKELRASLGSTLEIVVFGDFEKDQETTNAEINRALKFQLWKITKYSKKQSQTEQDDDEDDKYSIGGWTESDLRHANFIALTDGMYGDYDDFRGNWDDIDDWAGR